MKLSWQAEIAKDLYRSPVLTKEHTKYLKSRYNEPNILIDHQGLKAAIREEIKKFFRGR